MKNRLKILRKSLGLTQGEFGEKIGMTDASISHMESERTAFSEQNIKLICLTFGVKEEWFRHGTGEMLDEEAQLSVEDQELLSLFHALTPRARKLLIEYAAKLVADEQTLRSDSHGQSAGEKAPHPIHDKARA